MSWYGDFLLLIICYCLSCCAIDNDNSQFLLSMQQSFKIAKVTHCIFAICESEVCMFQTLNKELSTTQIIALGFLGTIFIGALILCLPFSSADGNFTPFIDALFTSTTSVCVTGLVVVNTAIHWSLFGKIVILILIQLGGLGIVSFVTGIMTVSYTHLTLPTT